MGKGLIKVKVGQVWEECDPRMARRQFKVLAIKGDKAVVQSAKAKTRIRLDRFRENSTGYRLVKDV